MEGPRVNGSGNSNLQHVCEVCNRLLTSPYKLREHMMIHTGEKPHVCQVCKQAFRTKPDLARHMRIHTGERPYSCKLCGQSFHRSDNLRGHMKVHKDKDGLQFADTTQVGRNRNTIQPVRKKSTAPRYIAPKVKEDKNRPLEIKPTEPVVNNGLPKDIDKSPEDKKGHFLCAECDSTFFQKGALAMHMKLVHSRGTSRSSSPMVSLSSNSPSPVPQTDSNYIVQASSTIYLCRFCGTSFNDLSSLEKHTATLHEKNPVVDHNENHTGVDENMNRNAKDEWVIEIDSDAESSDDTSNSVNGNSEGMKEVNGNKMADESLNLSMNGNNSWDGSSDGEKVFGCDECSQKFAWKQDLSRHKAMLHTGQVPYRCTACGKGFLRQDRLIAHIRVHTGKSPHTCTHCHKSFTASSSLKEHMKIHTGEKPHHCYLCGKDFRQKCVLTRHVRNVHKVDNLDEAIVPPTEPSDLEEEMVHVISPQKDDTAQCEPMDFSKTRADSPIKITPVNVTTAEQENQPVSLKKSNTGMPIYMTKTPVLLEQLNNSVKFFDGQTVDNGKSNHSCAACNMWFSNREALSAHLTTHHVVKLQHCDPIQKPAATLLTPRSNIPNVVIKQDNITNLAIGEIIIKQEAPDIMPEIAYLDKHQELRNGLNKPHINGYTSAKSMLHGIANSRELDLDYDLPRSGISESSPPDLKYIHQMTLPIKCPLKCSLCGLMFGTQEELNNHTDGHIKANPFFCSLCTDTFRSTTDLEEHIKTHSDLIENIKDLKEGELVDSAAEGSIMCSVCREQLEEESELAEHMKMHCPGRGTATHSCTLCDESFEKADQMNTHFGHHHCSSPEGGSNLRLYGCNFCFKPFKKVRTLVLHLKSHLMDKPHLCEMCGKSFSQAVYLKQHVRTHTGERPYCCNVCNRRFTQKTQLTLHERQHRGETPFQCDTCGKAFTNKSVLKLHLTTHLPLPPYRCNICGRRFTQAGNVRRHIGMVHKDVSVSDDPMYTCDQPLSLTLDDSREEEEEEPQEKKNDVTTECQALDLTRPGTEFELAKSKDSSRDSNGEDRCKVVNGQDDDDLLVMGAYYQQKQGSVSPKPADFTLKKILNTKNLGLSVGNIPEIKNGDNVEEQSKNGRKRRYTDITADIKVGMKVNGDMAVDLTFESEPVKKKPTLRSALGCHSIGTVIKTGKAATQSNLGTSKELVNGRWQEKTTQKTDSKFAHCNMCVGGFTDVAALSSHLVSHNGATKHA